MPSRYRTQCIVCGKLYYGKSPWFCSLECRKAHNWETLVCQYCGKEYKARICDTKRGKKLKYCSNKCAGLSIRRHEIVEYKGMAFYLKDGYYKSDKTNKPLHRMIWQDAHGPIPEGYYVHHINGDKSDNRIENLDLLTPSEHTTLHDNIRWQRLAALRALGVEA